MHFIRQGNLQLSQLPLMFPKRRPLKSLTPLATNGRGALRRTPRPARGGCYFALF